MSEDIVVDTGSKFTARLSVTPLFIFFPRFTLIAVTLAVSDISDSARVVNFLPVKTKLVVKFAASVNDLSD
jgi:hypothetical protein